MKTKNVNKSKELGISINTLYVVILACNGITGII